MSIHMHNLHRRSQWQNLPGGLTVYLIWIIQSLKIKVNANCHTSYFWSWQEEQVRLQLPEFTLHPLKRNVLLYVTSNA